MLKRFAAVIVLLSFFFSSILGPNAAHAQALFLPEPGTMVQVSPSFEPLMIKGLTIHPEDPLLFDFIMDTGNTDLKADMADPALKSESEKLIKYFLASLAIPDEDQWVNLSPYEGNRILPDSLGKTELGRDMLAQDYVLKQVTSSLIYPEKELGKAFWARVYEKAQQKFGVTDIPLDVINKVWITAESASVYVKGNSAFVANSHLKVQLESDYLAMKQQAPVASDSHASEISKQVIREIVLPELEKEVNAGQNFAPLRQIFHSMILAVWYKKNLIEALLSQVYADKVKTDGVEGSWVSTKGADIDPQQIYAKYVQAFQKGVFNYIKEDTDPSTGEMIPRKYFSGGVVNPRRVDRAETPTAEMNGVGTFLKLSARFDPSQGSLHRQHMDPEVREEINTRKHRDFENRLRQYQVLKYRKKTLFATALRHFHNAAQATKSVKFGITLGAIQPEERFPGHYEIKFEIAPDVEDPNRRLNRLVDFLRARYFEERRKTDKRQIIYPSLGWIPIKDIILIGEHPPRGLNGDRRERWIKEQRLLVEQLLVEGQKWLDASQSTGKLVSPMIVNFPGSPLRIFADAINMGAKMTSVQGQFLAEHGIVITDPVLTLLSAGHDHETVKSLVEKVRVNSSNTDPEGKETLKFFIAARYAFYLEYTEGEDLASKYVNAFVGHLDGELGEDEAIQAMEAAHGWTDISAYRRNELLGHLKQVRDYYAQFVPYLSSIELPETVAAPVERRSSSAAPELNINTDPFDPKVNRDAYFLSHMAKLVTSAFHVTGDINEAPVWKALTGSLPSQEWKDARDRIFPKDKFKDISEGRALFAVYYGLLRMPNLADGRPVLERPSTTIIDRITGSLKESLKLGKENTDITAIAIKFDLILPTRKDLDGFKAIDFKGYYKLANDFFGTAPVSVPVVAAPVVKVEAPAPVKPAGKIKPSDLDVNASLIENLERAAVAEGGIFGTLPKEQRVKLFELAKDLASYQSPNEVLKNDPRKSSVPADYRAVFAVFTGFLSYGLLHPEWKPSSDVILYRPVMLAKYAKGLTLPAEADDFVSKTAILKEARPIYQAFDAAEKAPVPAILVVDDEFMLRDLSEAILNSMYPGVPVIHASSGEQAKQFFDEGKYDFRLMITDNDMEKKGAGLELMAYIRDKLNNQSVKILFNTGVLDGQKKSQAKKWGAEVLAKPYTMVGFNDKVSGLKPNFDPAQELNGGIDLNGQKMDLTTLGDAARLTFDPAMIEQFKRGDFTGLIPVILSVTPISSLPI